MPVVPITQRRPSASAPPPIDEPWALMAAAQMHSEGRLVTAMNDKDFRQSIDVEDRRGQTKAQMEAAEIMEGSNDPGFTADPSSSNSGLAKALGAASLDKRTKNGK